MRTLVGNRIVGAYLTGVVCLLALNSLTEVEQERLAGVNTAGALRDEFRPSVSDTTADAGGQLQGKPHILIRRGQPLPESIPDFSSTEASTGPKPDFDSQDAEALPRLEFGSLTRSERVSPGRAIALDSENPFLSRPRGRRPTSRAPRLAPVVSGELIDLQETYEEGLVYIFGSSEDSSNVVETAQNPFVPDQGAIDEPVQPEPSIDAPEPDPDPVDLEGSEGPQDDPDLGPADPIDGDNPGGGGGSDVVDEPDLEQGFEFLVVGNFNGPSGPQRVFRANNTESGYLLENFFPLRLSPSKLANARVIEEAEQVVTGDLDANGTIDYVVAEQSGDQFRLKAYLRDNLGRFHRRSQALIRSEIVSFSLFDFDDDEDLEVVVALEGNPYLVVYKRISGAFFYLRELTLPKAPGLLVSGLTSAGESVLHVYDSTLSEQMDVLVVGNGAQVSGPFPVSSQDPIQNFEIHFLGRAVPTQVVAIEGPERITLFEWLGGQLQFVGAFEASRRVPTVIWGDHLAAGRRDLIYIP